MLASEARRQLTAQLEDARKQGMVGPGPVAALGSIALVLGGIVSLGSNVSTLRQTEAAISAVEARRSDLIGGIDLRLVRDAPVKLM